MKMRTKYLNLYGIPIILNFTLDTNMKNISANLILFIQKRTIPLIFMAIKKKVIIIYIELQEKELMNI
uniref:Uncharacterized protein n=1 Tax=Meloidogyne enterolobii TaxID=390850 RepID=A0A6V7V0F6_MELEN|nr:unnamed protein product [Meloidogyne enterolobii]